MDANRRTGSPSSGSVECPVCLDVFSSSNVVKTRCNHCFCLNCSKEILKSSKCPFCRQGISAFNTTRLNTGKPLAEMPTTIYGSVYVQCDTEGLASYHFTEYDSYISYSSAPFYWRLEDGTLPPAKKPFTNPTFDPSNRTFRAVVHWSPVSFAGDAKWVYTMVFSEDYMRIESGEVICFNAQGESTHTDSYGVHLVYKRKFEF